MSEVICYEKDSDNIVVLIMDMLGQFVNIMNEKYKVLMDECIDCLEQEEVLVGVVIMFVKSIFFVGGDFNDLVKVILEVV